MAKFKLSQIVEWSKINFFFFLIPQLTKVSDASYGWRKSSTVTDKYQDNTNILTHWAKKKVT